MMEHALKLTDVSITSRIDNRTVSLKEMHRRLNLVVVESSEHRRRIRRFLSSALGPAGSTWQSISADSDQGYLHFVKGHRHARLGIGPERYWSVDGLSPQTSGAMDQDLALWMTAHQRNAFANVLDVDCDFEQPGNSAEALNLAIQSYVGRFAGESASGWKSESEYRAWRDESRQRTARLEAVQSEIHRLEHQRQQLASRLVEIRGNATLRLQAEQDLAATSHSVRHLSGELSRLEEQRDRLDRELAVLGAELQTACSRPVAVNVVGHDRLNRLVALFERMDEMDLQSASLQQMHESIQLQRLRLRNESEKWTELTLDSVDHPWHKVWEIVEHVDSIVAQIDNAAAQKPDRRDDGRVLREIRFADHPGAHQFALETTTHCERIGAGLRSLCGELEGQYKHVRHRATVAEMRQLRRCFDEVAAHLDSLSARRNKLAQEIFRLDPPLEAVLQKHAGGFMQLLRTDGFQTARAHFLGERLSNAPFATTGTVRDSDTTSQAALRNRLDELTRRRQVVDQELRQTRDQLQSARNRLHDQTGMLDRYRQSDSASLETQEAELGRQIADRRAIMTRLQMQIDDDSRRPAFVPSPAMQMANQILEQISDGNLVRFETGGTPTNVSGSPEFRPASGWGVSDRNGRHVGLESLSSGMRRDCRVSLAFAAQRQMRILGEEIPLLVELSGSQLKDDWMIRFTRLLEQHGMADHQVVLMCDRRPVLSSESEIERNDLFRIFDLSRIAASESTARIVSWQKSDALLAHRLDPAHGGDFGDRQNILQPTHRFSSSLAELRVASARVTDFPVVETAITEETLLRNLALCPKHVCESLESIRVFTVADLMELDPFELPESIDERTVPPEELDRIQAASWLMLCVPGMGTTDANLLVLCGVVEPEQLDSISPDQLQSRIARYLASSKGVPARESEQRYSIARLERWLDSLGSTRDSWRQPSGYSRHLRRQPNDDQDDTERNNLTGYFTRERNRSYQPGDRYFDDHGRSRPSLWRSPDDGDDSDRNKPPREPRGNAGREKPGGGERDDRGSNRNPAPPPASDSSREARRGESTGQLPDGMKFYLNLDDSVEAAPSIGPKTAQRFEKIGVKSIREFLRTTSESMADRLNYKRITADVVRQWQDQSRLVCRVPNLRGHDAQLLVACGITEAEQLEGMSPGQLISLVGPYSDTKEGMKIVRSGKKPDLAEVTEWINCARHTRSLTAA